MTHMAHQMQCPVQQHPPIVGRSCLPEQLLARREIQLLADREQLAELVVAQVVEKGDRAQVLTVDDRTPSIAGEQSPGRLIGSFPRVPVVPSRCVAQRSAAIGRPGVGPRD